MIAFMRNFDVRAVLGRAAIREYRWVPALALAAALCPALQASGTAAWEMSSYGDFIRGRFDGISLSRDGRLSLAPKLDPVFSSDQAAIWSVAQAPDGTLYAATGHRGRIYKIDRAGKSSLLWTADQPEIFAIAVDRNGTLFAGSSPNGAVYRIDANGKASQYFAPGTAYIWSLTVAPDGSLYVGTGNQGRIFRVDPQGKGELYYDTDQSHITGLALDSQNRLLAGTEPNGILYRISAKDKGFVLYDAVLPEIRSIVAMPDGAVYAAALGGSVAKREQAAQSAQPAGAGSGIPTVTTTITVEAQQSSEIKPPDPSKQQVQEPVPQGSAAQATTTYTPAAVEVSGIEKSAIYRVNPDNTVETLWTSKEENAYDLLAPGNRLWFSTDARGRVYELTADRSVNLVTEISEGETTRLLPSGNSVLAATANLGRIFRLGGTPGAAGSYESPVHDAGAAARWGSVTWRASATREALTFRTRTGNSAIPDKTWSEWSAPLTDPSGSPVTSPNARYVQWKVEMAGAASASPVVNSVSLAYLPQNSPPVVRNVSVINQAVPSGQPARTSSTQASASSAYSITVTDTGDSSSATSAGTPTQVLPRAALTQIMITWQADDADGDRLVYALHFRGEDESEWKLLKSDLHENTLSFDSDVFADGRYLFRVTVSDSDANPPATAREAHLTSSPVMVDNTPPVVTIGTARREGNKARIEFQAADAASPLRRCEYSVDAGRWTPVEAVDGVIDGMREKFVVDAAGIPPGERLIVVRVADSAGNTGLAKATLK